MKKDINDDAVILDVFREVSKPAAFGRSDVFVSDGWVIRIHREWREPEMEPREIDTEIKLDLYFTGPCNGPRTYSSVDCSEMMEVAAATAKLIEDCHKLKWSIPKQRWRF